MRIFTLLFFLYTSVALFSQDLGISFLSTYQTGIFDEGAAEITAYDPSTYQVFFTNADANSIGILSISDPSQPTIVGEIDMSPYGGGVNSVAFSNGLVAVAVEADVKQDPGSIVIFDTEGNFLTSYQVGALPDMVTFNIDGTKILTANEGEPNDDYTVDPEGSVSVIDISAGLDQASITNIGFENYNNKIDEVRAKGIRIYGPGASVSQDLEPEFVTVTPDNLYAFVVCQENNAMAKIDLMSYEIVDLFPLGLKDHRFEGNGLDASNRSDDIEIQTWPVFGMYQPDAIASYTAGDGNQYIITANEGDSRDYDGYSEEERVKDLTLNPTNYPDAATLQMDENIGRLKTTTASGDLDGDGVIDLIHIYGGRSFTIWDTECKRIYDSGDEFEQILAQEDPSNFNSTNDDNDSFKNRSDDKGPEPEAVETFEIFGSSYAAIGLERMGGILLYNVSDPTAPTFIDYFNNRNFDVDAESPDAGDLGIEDIVYVAPDQSPNGQPMLITANEVSGTVSLFALNSDRCNASSLVATSTGASQLERCVGDVAVNMSNDYEGEGDYWYIITDTDNTILAAHNSADGDLVDLSGAPAGTCLIWGWLSDGTITPELGTSALELQSGCNQLSDNYITVDRLDDGPCAAEDICEQPSNLKLRRSSGNRYSLSWDRINDAQAYQVKLIINGTDQPGLITFRSNKINITSGSTSDIQIQIRSLCKFGATSLFSDPVTIPGTDNKSNEIISNNGIIIEEEKVTEPLFTVSPNPFEYGFEYSIGMDSPGKVSVDLIDITGQVVEKLLYKELGKGTHRFVYNRADLNSGMYFLAISKDNSREIIKISKIDR